MNAKDALDITRRWPDGHFLLCRADNKAPAVPWLNYRPSGPALATHLDQGGLVGVVPHSLGYAVLDVDEGQPWALALEHPPARIFATRRLLGAHLWYRTQNPYSNAKWRWEGLYGQIRHVLSGELRVNRGYVILWHDAARRLLDLDDEPDAVPFEEVWAAIRPPEQQRLEML